MQVKEAQFIQKFVALSASAADGGLWEGMLFRYNEVDAHGDRFLPDAEVVVYGEPPIFVNHDYSQPPVGKIVQVSKRIDGVYVYVKLNVEKPFDLNYLSVGGYIYDAIPSPTGLNIKKIVVMEASLTQSPAQPNEPLKKLATMNTTEKKAEAPAIPQGLEEIKAELQEIKKALTTSLTPAPRVAKQDLAALESMIVDLQTRVSAIETALAELSTKYESLQQEILALQQAQSMTESAVQESAQKMLKDFETKLASFIDTFVKVVQTKKSV